MTDGNGKNVMDGWWDSIFTNWIATKTNVSMMRILKQLKVRFFTF